MAKTMRGVQVQDNTEKHVVFRDDIPIPQPSDNELLIRIRASQINPSDVMNVLGKFPQTTFPRIPGRDYSGVVLKAPAGSHITEGTSVYGTSGKTLSFTTDGVHADYAVVPVGGVAVKPEKLTFVQAAGCGTPFTTASLALSRAHAQAGSTVLVVGSTGGVGSAVCQVAKKLGCRVIEAARRDTTAVDLRKDPNLESVKDLTAGRGVDIAIDTVGSPELQKSALKTLAAGGRLSIISVAGYKGEPEMSVNLRDVYRLNQSIVGSNSVGIDIVEMAEALQQMSSWFDSGALTAPSEAAYTMINIEDLTQAYEDSIAGKAKGKKFMVVFEEK